MTSNIECPFCFYRHVDLDPKSIAKGQLQCLKCSTVFNRAVAENPYAYSLNKNVDTGIIWDK